jgi:hypothetical protein
VRVAERTAGVGIGALRNGRVAANEPDLAVRGRGEDVATARHESAGRDASAHAFAALPVAPCGIEVVGRVRLERRRDDVHVEERVHYGHEPRGRELGHAEELRDPGLQDHLVADPWRVRAGA